MKGIKLDNKKYIGEQITNEDIANWDKGSIVTIQAGTGSGKSHFIKNNLYDIAARDGGKILMLIHRVNCVRQFQIETEEDGKDDFIDIMTYQRIEYMINKGIGFDFHNYKYIVADEFHYFMGDANFNYTTDVSLERILRQNDVTRILMSATGNYMSKYINKFRGIETIDYAMDVDFDYLDEVEFYTSDASLEQYIEGIITNGEKAMVFVQKATKAYGLYKRYEEHALFNCGESNEHYKYVDSSKIASMLANERFEEPLLITTAVMDSGVNIKDKSVNKIIIDIEDRDVFVQCLGRRRVDRDDANDKVSVYIKRLSNEQLGGRITQSNERLKKARYLKEHGTSEYIGMYGRNPDIHGMIYDGIGENGELEKQINDLVRLKTEIDIVIYKEMTRVGHENYINEDVLQREPKDYTMKWKTERAVNLSDYLESRIGDVMLTVDDRKELIETVNVRRNGRLLRGIDTINKALEELNVSYKVVDYRIDKMVNGERVQHRAAWEVKKI